MSKRKMWYWRAFSVLKQAAYGTAVDDGDIDQAVPLNDPDFMAEDISRQDDLDEVGKGHEFATRLDEELRDSGLGWKGNLTSFLAGLFAAFGLGDVTTARCQTRSAAVFTGAGLDDATAGGTITPGGTAGTVTVEIDANTPDTFKISLDGGGTWPTTGVVITGAAQTITGGQGATITFAATTGHTIGDKWVITIADGSAYQHTFLLQDPAADGLQLPATSMVEYDPAGNKIKVRDLVLDSFKLSGKMKERVQFDTAWVGSGYTEDSTLTKPAVTQGAFLRMRGAQIQIGVSGAEVDLSQRVTSLEIGVANNLDKDGGYVPGCGLYRALCEFGERAVTATFNVLADSDVERGHIQANDLLKAIVTITGAAIDADWNHSMIVTLEQMKYKAAKRGWDGTKMNYALECQPLYYATHQGPIQIVVVNEQASYLA